ncbi:hypothetical protein ES708_34051 [subsurface metagenome]
MSKRTELHKAKMPRWIWQLRLEGFHVQKKKYLHFLWRQRPAGCNWSRELRARYFNRSIGTITRWDAFLLKWHLAWVSGKGTMEHRIGARPYYRRDTWWLKCFDKPLPKARRASAPPYTAQQKKILKVSSSSAGEQQKCFAAAHLPAELPAAKEKSNLGGISPEPPGGSGGPTAEDSPATRKANTACLQKIVYKGALSKLIDVGWPEERAKRLAQIKTDEYIAERGARLKTGEEKRAEDQRNEKPNSD